MQHRLPVETGKMLRLVLNYKSARNHDNGNADNEIEILQQTGACFALTGMHALSDIPY